MQSCRSVASIHPYATDDGAAENVDICAPQRRRVLEGRHGHRLRRPDVGDGKCPGDDCCYQPQTAFTTKSGGYLAASVTPYVVIPTDFRPTGLAGGGVVAVIYGGKLQYAVFGDTGPDNIIGEASYACAAALGIDPDPGTGGTDGPVTYIAFLGRAPSRPTSRTRPRRGRSARAWPPRCCEAIELWPRATGSGRPPARGRGLRPRGGARRPRAARFCVPSRPRWPRASAPSTGRRASLG